MQENSRPTPNFHIDRKDSHTHARLGQLRLRNGIVQTPAFMPVGTHGTVRGVSSLDLRESGADIMLGNTYHLYSRPGVELIEKLGGLHSFTSWKKPILTDSGGFQIFSLAESRKLTEEGVTFKNKHNGDLIHLNPEKVVAAQEKFGSDIMMVLDECPPATATAFQVAEAVERTTRWARRSQEARTRSDSALFAIFQGGSDLELRRRSLKQLLELETHQDPWDGIAIGGLSVGEAKEKFVGTLFSLRGLLPTDRPHYLMGVGTPRDLVFAVACGVDMFDCVLPSRNGRHGIVMTKLGRMNLLNSRYTDDGDPIEMECPCTTCQTFSRSFLRHLFMIEDALAGRLATIHNIVFFLELMRNIRERIANGGFLEFAVDYLRDQKHYFLGSEKGFTAYPEVYQ